MKTSTKLAAATWVWLWMPLGIDVSRWTDAFTTHSELISWWADALSFTSGIAQGVNNIIEWWTDLLEPVVWGFSWAILPAIAWAKWAHMLASKYGPDSMWFKWLATVTWWVLGWAASASVAWPYLAIAGLWVAAWKSPKVLEWIARKWIAVPAQWVKWIWDGWKRGKNAVTAKNWSSWEKWVFA